MQPDEILSDSALETRARTLSGELRCMVCQNQSIDDSDAPLARDLRLLVRERLTKGDSDDQVIGFLVSRYGEFVLLRPPFEWHTAILWLTNSAPGTRKPPTGVDGRQHTPGVGVCLRNDYDDLGDGHSAASVRHRSPSAP